MKNKTEPAWKNKRTTETRKIEDTIRAGDFEKVDAYRYNSASIRVRVIDGRFEGVPAEKRERMLEPYLKQLPERTQADIMSLFTFAPSELKETQKASREALLNAEFDDPSPSML